MKRPRAALATLLFAAFAGSGLFIALTDKPRAESLYAYTSAHPTSEDKKTYRNTSPVQKTFQLVTFNSTLLEPTTIETTKNIPIRIDISSTEQTEAEIQIPDFKQSTTIEGAVVSHFNFTPDRSGVFDIRIVNREIDEGPVLDVLVGKFIVH